MKHIQTFEQFLNEAVSQEAYRIHSITQCGQDAAQDFIDDNNIDSEKLITYLKQNVNSPKKYDIRDLIKDPKSNKMLLKQFTNEKIEYPEGVKTTGDKILDKLAKLLNSSKGIIEVGSGSVRGKKVPFQTGDAYFNITSQSDTYVLLCSNGDFEFPRKEIKNAEELFNQIEKAIQMGTVTIGKKK